jgi:predicted enzyme related to lactoylglutathione lyase
MTQSVPGNFIWYDYLANDAEAAIARGPQAGTVAMPEEVPGGARIAHLMDPQGGVFALHESKK